MSDQHKLDYPHSALTKGLGANIALRCSPENDRNTYSDSKWKHVRCKPVLSTTGIVPFCNYHNSCECFLSCCKAGMLYQTFLAALLSEIIYIYILSSFPPFSSPWTVVPQPSIFFSHLSFFFFFFLQGLDCVPIQIPMQTYSFTYLFCLQPLPFFFTLCA